MRPASFIGRIDNLLLDGQPWRRGLSSGKIPSVLERLRRNEVHVWYRFTEGLDADAVDRAVAVLSADERQRYARFRFERDRRDYAAAHALLRESLSRYVAVASASWRFERTLDGKPVLAQDHGFGLAFNLSHTPGAVVCAITGGNDVGVDVESTTRRVDHDVARAVCSEEEYADVQAGASHSERSRRFSERWTLKEAYVKAIGKGLSHPLNTVTFALRADGSIAFASSMEAGRSWHFALFAPSDAYRIAVAVRCEPGMRPRFQLMTEVSCVGAPQRRDKLSSKHTTEYLHGQKPACLGRVQR